MILHGPDDRTLTHPLRQMLGRPVLSDFRLSTCRPYIRELPDQLQHHGLGRSRLRVRGAVSQSDVPDPSGAHGCRHQWIDETRQGRRTGDAAAFIPMLAPSRPAGTPATRTIRSGSQMRLNAERSASQSERAVPAPERLRLPRARPAYGARARQSRSTPALRLGWPPAPAQTTGQPRERRPGT